MQRLHYCLTRMQRIEEEFDEIAQFYDTLPIAANKASAFLESRFPKGRERALDIGCGTGRSLYALSETFETIYGLDISTNMLHLTQRRCNMAKAPPHLVRGNAGDLPFQDEAFDLVVAHTVIHHLDIVEKGLLEIRRVLKTGGRMVVVDILRARLTGYAPVATVYLSAAIATTREFFLKGPVGASRLWRHATDSRWIKHQRGELFLEENLLKAFCRRVIPGAILTKTTKEYGCTSFVIIDWEK